MFAVNALFWIRYRIIYLFVKFFYGTLPPIADISRFETHSASAETTGKAKTKEETARAFDVYGNNILRLAYAYVHNMEDAEDILQETLIRYMDKAPAFENQEHEKAWLLRVAANLSKNKLEYNKLRQTDELNDELVADEETDLSFVWEAIKSLSTAQREAVHLFYQEGYSTAQIAGLLGQKESTVRSHLKRGREKLKEILKEDYDFDEI